LTDVYTSPQHSNNGVSVRHAACRAMFEHQVYTTDRLFKHPSCCFSALGPRCRNRYTIAAHPQALASAEGREELTHSLISRGMYDV
jgi:hypothetical protein